MGYALVANQNGVSINPNGGLMYSGTNIFCLGTDGKVYNYYYNTQWNLAPLYPSQPIQMDANAKLAQGDGNIYSLGTNGIMYRFTWNSQTALWQFYQMADQGSNSSPNSTGGILTAPGKVYCIGMDGKVYNYFGSNNGSGGWTYSVLVSNLAMLANPNDKLTMYISQIVIVGTDNKLWQYSFTTSWQEAQLCSGQTALVRNGFVPQVDNGIKIYFVATDNKLYDIERMGSGFIFNKIVNASQLGAQEFSASATSNLCFSTTNNIIYYAADISGYKQLAADFLTNNTVNYGNFNLYFGDDFNSYTNFTNWQCGYGWPILVIC